MDDTYRYRFYYYRADNPDKIAHVSGTLMPFCVAISCMRVVLATANHKCRFLIVDEVRRNADG